MELSFVILAVWILGGAVAAASLRNLVHCALCLAAVFAGLAAVFLKLDAEFVGFAQVMIYVGAVAVLIVLALLLTQNAGVQTGPLLVAGWGKSLAVSALLFVVLAASIVPAFQNVEPAPAQAGLTVRRIGESLMTEHVLTLEAVGLLLTAALIGAALIALPAARKTDRTTPTQTQEDAAP